MKARRVVDRNAESPALDAESRRRMMESAVLKVDAPTWTVRVRESSRCFNRETNQWEQVERPCVLHVSVNVPKLLAQIGGRAIFNKARKTTAQGGAIVVTMVWQGERPAAWPQRKEPQAVGE